MRWGADWLLEHERDAVYADYVLTESGGLPDPDAARAAAAGARGGEGHVLVQAPRARHAGPRVAAVPHRQRAGHRGRGGAPHRRVPTRRRRSTTSWRAVRRRAAATSPSSPTRCSAPTGSPTRSRELPVGVARHWHACTHTTFAPTVVHGGTKTNVIPDLVDLEVDIRTLPGQIGADATAMLRDALGDLADAVEIDVERRSRDVVTDRHAAVGLAGARERARSARARRWCRRSWWVPPTTASTGAPARSGTASASSRSACRTRTSR